MSNNDEIPQPNTAIEPGLQQLKNILLKDEDERVINAVRKDARVLVSEVLTEALKDRQKDDKSIATVLTPIVENSVERSISNNKDKFVGYLYPLVGSLVRKSVTGFFNELMEKTNKIIENSFTYKGLKWRIQAKQAGMSFAKYVISKTYVFRVEQVFLIHAETGLLISSVSLSPQSVNDADLMSSMLAAITDFVEDSFSQNKEAGESLDVIKTANFSLVIKNGPFAVIAAAVTGNMSEKIPSQLQYTLEQIHELYSDELQAFEGDAATLLNSEQQLHDCLITESFDEKSNKKEKKSLYALAILMIIISFVFYQIFIFIQPDEVLNKLNLLDDEAGIIVKKIEKNNNKYLLEVWRDPSAVTLDYWLKNNKISLSDVVIKENLFISVDEEIIQKKAKMIYESYSLKAEREGNTFILIGDISYQDKLAMQQQLTNIAGNLTFDITRLNIIDNDSVSVAQDDILAKHLLKDKIGQISAIQLDFIANSATLNEVSIQQLKEQTNKLKELFLLAKQLSLNVAILVIGTSDKNGLKKQNILMSQQRASVVKAALIHNGINANKLYSLGIGEIPLKHISADTRKVLFNVIYL